MKWRKGPGVVTVFWFAIGIIVFALMMLMTSAQRPDFIEGFFIFYVFSSLFIFPILGIICIILAIILFKKNEKKPATFNLVMGIIALVLCVILLVGLSGAEFL